MRSYFDGLLRYFEFSGRTSRAQYWLYQSVVLLLIIAAFFADYKLSGRAFNPRYMGFLTTFVMFFHTVPGVTVTVRRLHDVGKSGWWYLLVFVPFGGLWVLVWTCYASDGSSDEVDPRDKIERGKRPAARQNNAGFGNARSGSLSDIENRRAARPQRMIS